MQSPKIYLNMRSIDSIRKIIIIIIQEKSIKNKTIFFILKVVTFSIFLFVLEVNLKGILVKIIV
jgi:hypothetical protein